MTAPVWEHPDVMDNGLAYVKSNCNSVALIDYAYAAGDSYATVRGASDANVIAEKTGLTSSDHVLANQGTNGRKLTIPASTGNTALKTSSGTTGYTKFAVLDTVNSKVLLVFDSGSDQVITVGNPVNFSALVFNVNQPTG